MKLGRVAMVVGCTFFFLACGKTQATPNEKPERTAPICARQDCATRQIIDDGCANGQCLACVNACPADRDD